MQSKRMAGHTEFAVDTSDQFVDDSSEVLVFFHILSAWDGDLHKDDLSNPFRMIGEEDFKGVEFLGDAFDVVKSVYANHELDTFELFLQDGDSLLDLFFFEALCEFLGVDSDGESADGDDLVAKFDTIGSGGEVEDTGTTAQEMAGVIISMKADQIAVEDAQKDLISDWKDSVDFTGWERGV